MEYRQLGNSGLMVSAVGLGCNNFGVRCDLGRTREVVDAAFDSGVNFFDTADIYGGKGGSETFLGDLLGTRRDDIVLATKFGMDMGTGESALGSRRYIRRAVEASLRRLKTDRIDLYQFHQPDPLTPIEETISTLGDLVREGKVLYIGCSNFTGWQLAEAHAVATSLGVPAFVSVQNRYSVMAREIEVEVLDAAERFGAGVLPYYPLESGLLTGKFQRGLQAPVGTRLASRPEELENANYDLVEALTVFATDHHMELLDVAVRYLLSHPVVSSVIAGATSGEQLRRNVKTLDAPFTPEVFDEIERVLAPWSNLRDASRASAGSL
jgi:aryl-alcohol dehydrogenase-like predicted oxidoreductase